MLGEVHLISHGFCSRGALGGASILAVMDVLCHSIQVRDIILSI